MKKKFPFWLILTASLLLGGLIVNQIFWVYKSAQQQEEQFNKQIQMALASIEKNIQQDPELCTSVGGCLIDEKAVSCSPILQNNQAWTRTDKMIKGELNRFDIALNYNFDICYKSSSDFSKIGYEQNMDKVFDKSGIVLYLEFPDKTKYLRNQIGPVFISSILLIIFLSIVFALTYRFYRKERDFSQRTRDFINNMTHEFKTPLTNISLANNMIARGINSGDAEKLEHYSAIIDEENQRLSKNCDDLLQMAKIENEEQVNYDLIDAHAIIERVIARKKKTKLHKKLTVTCDLGASRFQVLGRESLFSNTVSNLIDNAIKYSGEDLTVEIKTVNSNDMLHLQINDNGIGIKDKDLPNIFDKFYRVSEGDKHNVKGFGLGLAYVKMVVNKMRGSVNVESKFGLGTTFNISIPTAKNL